MDLLSITLLVWLTLTAWFPGRAEAGLNLTSPGPLAEAHAKYDGPDQCTLCHEQGKQVVAAKCLDCHKELRKGIDEKRGYHGRMGAERNACSKCHPDHAGRDLKLIAWDKGQERFDHALTGYTLQGKHSRLKCADCHKTRSFLGLSTVCADCHADIHRGEVGKKCESCHDSNEWKPAPLFDHQKTRYPLTGKHSSVTCAKCHPSVGEKSKPRLKLTGIPHDTCRSCHKDVHQGKFGPTCEKCHSTEDWKKVLEKGMPDKAFHDKTRYPLLGAHAKVACVACHGPFKGVPAVYRGLKFERCTDCHLDAHFGQMTRTDPARTCDRCHTLEKFLPVTYTVADHAQSRYPLIGAHTKAECRKCHGTDKDFEKKLTTSERKKLRARGRKELVSLTRFRFEGRDAACESCHEDIHAGQFAEARGARSPCQKCHTTELFKGKSLFDHNDARFTTFSLDGKHRSVPCEKCHRAVPVAENVRIVKYVGLPKTCEGCHVDEHKGAFRGFEP